MTELLTAAQMRAIERAAIESGEVTGLELMERAGRGVVEAIFEEWPELKATSHRAVVLCGPGNNGGDGFVVARLLKEWGWEVEVFLYGDPENLPPDARVNYERWLEFGNISSWVDGEIENTLDEASHDLVVDALFGTGLTRQMPEELTRTWHGFVPQVFGEMPADRPKYVAVDIPSGLSSDSGRNLEGALPADLTVSFHSAKLGHYLAPEGPPAGGPLWCGKVVIKDIGLPHAHRGASAPLRPRPAPQGGGEIAPTLGPGAKLAAPYKPVRLMAAEPLPKLRKANAHKYTHGHAVILSGPAGKGGAARLAARGALRIGAGLVTVACPPAALQENAARLDAIMLKPVKDAGALAEVLADDRLNAICLGPGLGVTPETRALVATALGHPPETPVRAPAPEPGPHGEPTGSPTLGGGARLQAALAEPPARAATLDADALTAFADDPDTLFAMLHPACVLTPHAGEFARLFPDIAGKLNAPATKGPAYSKVDATREAAARAGCTVLFKGPDTVIADETGAARINSAHYDRAAPWLATAGAGDVLAGMITGLLARGFPPLEAAATAAWLHVECALSFGPGLIAEDIPEELPKVFRGLSL